MARFCLAYNIAPSEYRQMTRIERAAFNEEAARLAAERST